MRRFSLFLFLILSVSLKGQDKLQRLFDEGRYDSLVETAISSLPSLSTAKDSAYVYKQTASVFLVNGDFKNAIRYYQKSLHCEPSCKAWVNLGGAYYYANLLDSAIYADSMGMTMATTFLEKGGALNNLSLVYIEKEDTANALRFCQLAQGYFKSAHDTARHLKAWYNEGVIYLNAKRFSESRMVFDSLEVRYQSFMDAFFQKEFAYQRYLLEVAEGNHEAALTRYQHWKSLSDSLNVADLEEKTKRIMKEHDLRLLQVESAKQEEINELTLIYGGILLCVLILGGIGWYYFERKRLLWAQEVFANYVQSDRENVARILDTEIRDSLFDSLMEQGQQDGNGAEAINHTMDRINLISISQYAKGIERLGLRLCLSRLLLLQRSLYPDAQILMETHGVEELEHPLGERQVYHIALTTIKLNGNADIRLEIFHESGNWKVLIVSETKVKTIRSVLEIMLANKAKISSYHYTITLKLRKHYVTNNSG
ncbi:hypothetical protein KFE98_19770 [bacterium SCSIO 12741]|nr:hypothetical protein KFE98_19770 [bacterium SCSIO 12741]